MAIGRAIYDHSPVFLQNLAIAAYGYRLKRRRYGREYYRYRKFLVEFDNLSREEQLAFQEDELNALIKHARQNSSFYRRLYAGLDLPERLTVADLRLLPIVDKEMLRSNMDEVVAIDKRTALVGHTGGTTGKSLTVYSRQIDMERRMAILDHFKARHGFENREMRRVTFNGKHIIPPGNAKPVFWRYNASIKQRIYSSFHLTEKNLPYYLKDLNDFQPAAIDGFFTSIYELASFVLRNDLKLSFKPLAIFPTAETVTPRERAIIEEAFGCPVRDQYASSEGAPFITECTHGRLHYEVVSGVFEPCNLPDAEENEALVTSFSTYGTPLIRYRIGDAIELAPPSEYCSCDLPTPLVKRIIGRGTDFLYSDQGAKVSSVQVANMFKYCPNSVVQAQLIQDKVGAVKILVVPDPRHYTPEDDRLILREAKHTLGPNTDIHLHKVSDIPRAKSGKHRLIENRVPSF